MSHPYKQFEKTRLWMVLEEGLAELIENDDVEEKAPSEYIIGYLCKKISDEFFKPK